MNSYSEENGPDQACADTIDGNTATQTALYQELTQYNLADNIRDADGNVVSADFYKVDTIDDIEYYTPNDEDWGAIVAVSHEHKLALYTGFYEMFDMAAPAPGDDYKMVVIDGKMGCKFTFDEAEAA